MNKIVMKDNLARREVSPEYGKRHDAGAAATPND